MVPDVAANADPETGYEIVLHGAPTVVSGTSGVAPLYAGLFAAFGSKLGFVTHLIHCVNSRKVHFCVMDGSIGTDDSLHLIWPKETNLFNERGMNLGPHHWGKGHCY
jgi:hypothetical protein